MECSYECQDIGEVPLGSHLCCVAVPVSVTHHTIYIMDHLDETCFTVPAKRIPLADEMQVSKALHINYHLSAVHQDMGYLDKPVGPVASTSAMRRHLADEIQDSKGDLDNLISLRMRSGIEASFDQHCPFSPEKTLIALEPLEDIECMNYSWDILTKRQRKTILPCLEDFREIANHFKLISGVYRNDQAHGKVTFQMEDCAFNGKGNRWLKEVKFRIQKSHLAPRNNPKNPWMDLHELYPNAEVEMKRNIVKVTIDSPQENHEFAVFGIPDVNDRKRMQVGLFGEKPLQGEDWKIWVILFDDTMMAFQHVCKMEEGRGRELLTTLAGLFVFNSGEDIKINVMDVELGWKIKDGNEKIIKSNDAWNSPENSTDFPCCHFEVSHVDQGKKTFTCGITVSHLQDSAEAEVTAFFEEPKKDREEIHLPFAGDIATDDFSDVLVFLQMFVMAMWFINSAVQPAGVLLDPN